MAALRATFAAYSALLVLVAAFSGCVGGWGSPDAKTATALEALAYAKQITGADTASLRSVFTLEAKDADAFVGRGPPAWLLAFLNASDPTPGDGQAHAWGFEFGEASMSSDGHAHSGSAELVIVSETGKVLYRAPKPADFPIKGATPLGDQWAVDSLVAAQRARDAPWVNLMSKEGAYSFASLAIRIGSPAAWIFEGGVADSGEGDSIAADARDGAKIRLGTRDPFAPIATEAGKITGTATTSGSTSSFTIVHPGHRELEFFLEIQGGGGGVTQTGGQLEFTASGPGGQSFPFHWDGSGGTNQAWFQFAAPAAGEWTLVARFVGDASTTQTSQAFSTTWCALGASRCP
jgi:hypothetical protein